MRIDELNLLTTACNLAAARRQRGSELGGDLDATGIRDELDGFIGYILEDRDELKVRANDSLQPWLVAIDLALLQFCDLAHFAWLNEGTDQRILWPRSEPPSDDPSSAHVFYLLAANMAQTYHAARLLLVCGFEGQSRAMVRNLVELLDLVVAVTADEDFYNRYVTSLSHHQEAFKYWRKWLSPRVIRDRLRRLDTESHLSPGPLKDGAEIREDTYRLLSRFSHIDFVAHFVTALPTRLQDGARAPVAMLGQHGVLTQATMRLLLRYCWLFFAHFNALTRSVHQWELFRDANDRRRYFQRAEVFEALIVVETRLTI